MSIGITLGYLGQTTNPEGDIFVMFATQSFDEADAVTVTITATMSRAKWIACGMPTSTDIEIEGNTE